MSEHNPNELDNNKNESFNSNYDKDTQENLKSAKTKWGALMYFGMFIFVLGIISNVFQFPIQIPFGFIFLAWICAAFGGYKLSKVKAILGENPMMVPFFWSEEAKDKWVRSQASAKDARSSIGNCLKDFRKRHSLLWLVPIFFFWGFGCFIFYIIYATDLRSSRIQNMPSTVKELFDFMKKNHPVYSIILLLIALVTPFIVIGIGYLFFINSSKYGEDAMISMLSALIALIPSAIATNFLCGFLGFPFAFISNLKSNND